MSVETNSHNYTNMNLTFSQFKPARISPKQKEEQAEDSSPDPSSSACDIRIQKKESAEVLRNPFPRKLFPQNFVGIVSDFLIRITFKKGSNFVQ